MTDKVTHRELCEIGAKYLANHIGWKMRCPNVLIEFCSSSAENPDIFGLRGDKSICVEVKVSRSDFRRDILKPHRHTGGIGLTRFYLCPKGMIRADEINNGWGLLEYDKDTGKIDITKESEFFNERYFASELTLMQSVIRRLSGGKKILDFRLKNN